MNLRPVIHSLVIPLALTMAGCSGGGSDGPTNPPPPTNHAPTVSINISTAHLGYGGTATATVIAADADGDQLTYSYAATKGTVSSSGPTATTATYTAGAQWGAASVTVTVSDGQGGSTQATATTYIRNPTPPHLCVRPGAACTSTFKLGLYPAEALVVTSVYAYNASYPQCAISKSYGAAGLTIAANTLHSFDDTSCPTCPQDPSNLTWNVTVQGHRPEPDGGTFDVELDSWDPTDSTPGPCN